MVQAGTLSITLLINSQPISGSPFTSVIAPGPVSANTSTLGGPDPYGCVRGWDCLLYITPRDAWGNARGSGDDAVVAKASNGSAVVQSWDAATGVYVVSSA